MYMEMVKYNIRYRDHRYFLQHSIHRTANQAISQNEEVQFRYS